MRWCSSHAATVCWCHIGFIFSVSALCSLKQSHRRFPLSLSYTLQAFIYPVLLFLDATFEVFLHLTASPLGVRRNTSTLLLLTQITHLQTNTHTKKHLLSSISTQVRVGDFSESSHSFSEELVCKCVYLLEVFLTQVFKLFAVFL